VALMFLLDTSVLTRLSAPPILRRIEELDGEGLARTTMTDLEIGSSACLLGNRPPPTFLVKVLVDGTTSE
jgi:hypothetical protein